MGVIGRTVVTVALVAGLSGWLGEALGAGLGKTLALRRLNRRLSGHLESDLRLLASLASGPCQRGCLEADLRQELVKVVHFGRAVERRDCGETAFELAKGCELTLGAGGPRKTPNSHLQRLTKALIEEFIGRCGLGERKQLLEALAGARIAASDRAKVRNFGQLVYTQTWLQRSDITGRELIREADAMYLHLSQRKISGWRFAKAALSELHRLGELFEGAASSGTRSEQVRHNLRELFERHMAGPCRSFVEPERVRRAGERAVFALRYTSAKADYSDKEYANAVRDYRACSLLLEGQAERLCDKMLEYC